MEALVYKDKKMLRRGYTTGTCAALAAQGAVSFLVSGIWPETAELMTPAGQMVRVPLMEKKAGNGAVSCAVKKDAGDDPDVTDGLLIFARARFLPEDTGKARVVIDGGEGVGRVTKAGLDQPVGAAAINSVPRRMIEDAVAEVLEEAGAVRPVEILIFVPGGEKAAEKTFNPVLGITGGISILGTSGIVDPMSEEALIETIRAHMQVLRSEGRRFAAAVPGNMGERFLWSYLEREGIGKIPAVVCSNFVGRTLDIAGELGFSGLLLAGHLGKLVKLGCGIMNTHSKEGDGRMETLVACALRAGVGTGTLKRIQEANTTEQALEELKAAGILKETMGALLERMDWYMRRRVPETLETGILVFDAAGTLLGATENARDLLALAAGEEPPGGDGSDNGI
ncbi:MAG: cobalt-precorrin-5B (C(1))-methyltransferase CbiD [Alitiscatomonas sp.]